ncbi:MAG: 5-(carboxyamino)imidazole ribonucleotide mutase [Patescibacteria group bacterium]
MVKNPKVVVIIGSDSDLEVATEAVKVLENFGVSYEITVASAHRSPEIVNKYVTRAKDRGIKIIIAGAGGAAHLAGVVASFTTLPVIGIPIKTKNLNGLDSLLSTVCMPPGVPVATVGINASKNAGLLAVQMLALYDKNLEDKLVAYKQKMSGETKAKGEKLLKIGFKKYLENKNAKIIV